MSIEKIKNWVVVMFENRSFDNLLGHLEHIDAEDGVRGKTIELPYPGGIVTVHPGALYNDPIPDPGEGYANVNVQVYGRYLPESNQAKAPYLALPDRMQAPYNAPQPGDVATMDGFALDFYWNSLWQTGRELTDQEMQSIGGVFTPKTAPVINELAKEYAVFTNWHCDVPTCTFPNRAFFHSGTSLGKVDNDVVYNWTVTQDQPNLFDRLTEHNVDWKCYFDESQVVPLTAINLAGAKHHSMWKDHSHYMPAFWTDCAQGTLPRYSWVEPRMMSGEVNDYHPPTDVRAAEQFLASVYNAVRTSPQWEETALVIMFDEHGGTYDHVVPPAAVAPDDSKSEMDFTFDRYGIRVPTIVISAHTKKGTVIRDLHANTSMTRTLRETLGLGDAFTKRDANASMIDAAFNRSEPRRDMHQLDVLPFTPGITNPGAQEVKYGDSPDNPLVLAKWKKSGKDYVSELGQATLTNAAAMLGIHPDDAPTQAPASDSRAWLKQHFTKDGSLHFPTKG
ncbi:MAG: alkaline phosphatase family protein [Candidatus Nanopelagicales bacterium]